jgi:hypothetical protein
MKESSYHGEDRLAENCIVGRITSVKATLYYPIGINVQGRHDLLLSRAIVFLRDNLGFVGRFLLTRVARRLILGNVTISRRNTARFGPQGAL